MSDITHCKLTINPAVAPSAETDFPFLAHGLWLVIVQVAGNMTAVFLPVIFLLSGMNFRGKSKPYEYAGKYIPKSSQRVEPTRLRRGRAVVQEGFARA